MTTCDEIRCGSLKLLQPQTGPRVNLDTILLTHWVKFRSRHTNYIEAGCATGAVSLILARKFPHIRITGVEIQPELSDLARTNTESHGLSERVQIITGDIRDKSLLPRESFDVVVINPPYESQSRGRVSPDSSRSTARHELTCTPDDVGEFAARVLKAKGRLFSIFTSERLDVFINSLTKYRLSPKRIMFVHPDREHDSAVFLLESIKQGGEGLCVMPPLYVRDEKGEYTPEVLRAYELEGE